jgi:hypothetical protein
MKGDEASRSVLRPNLSSVPARHPADSATFPRAFFLVLILLFKANMVAVNAWPVVVSNSKGDLLPLWPFAKLPAALADEEGSGLEVPPQLPPFPSLRCRRRRRV